MKRLVKQTINTGEDFTLQNNVTEIDIFEDKYVASIISRSEGQFLSINADWHINLHAFAHLKQINIFTQGMKTVLIRGRDNMFPEFQADLVGAYTKTYLDLNDKVLAA